MRGLHQLQIGRSFTADCPADFRIGTWAIGTYSQHVAKPPFEEYPDFRSLLHPRKGPKEPFKDLVLQVLVAFLLDRMLHGKCLKFWPCRTVVMKTNERKHMSQGKKVAYAPSC